MAVPCTPEYVDENNRPKHECLSGATSKDMYLNLRRRRYDKVV